MQKKISGEIGAINNLFTRAMESKMRESDVDFFSLMNLWVIGYLYDNMQKDIYQKDIEREFCVTRSTVSKVLNLMEQKKLIIRKHVSHDARLKKLILTEKAKNLFAIFDINFNYMENVITAGFSDEEKETLFDFFDRLRKNLNSELIKQQD